MEVLVALDPAVAGRDPDGLVEDGGVGRGGGREGADERAGEGDDPLDEESGGVEGGSASGGGNSCQRRAYGCEMGAGLGAERGGGDGRAVEKVGLVEVGAHFSRTTSPTFHPPEVDDLSELAANDTERLRRTTS